MFRSFHRRIGYLIIFPFFVLISSGFLYRFLRNAIGMEKPAVAWILQIHYGKILGLEAIYPVFMGILTFLMLLSGFSLTPVGCWLLEYFRPSRLGRPSRSSGIGINSLIQFPASSSSKQIHRFVASLVAIPLSLTALTGVLFAISSFWMGIPKEAPFNQLLLTMHQGSYLGDPVIYVTILFICVFSLACTGLFQLSANSDSRSSSVSYTMLSVNRAFDASIVDSGLTSEEDFRGKSNSSSAEEN